MNGNHSSIPSRPRRILIVAGGTGGHVAPALAVGNTLRNAYGEEVLVRYLSGARPIERRVFDSADEFPDTLDYERPPQLSLKGVPQIWRYVVSIHQARNLLRSFRPDAVLAMGGYVCAPVLLAAWILRIPFYLHESNAIPGRVTRLFALGAECVFIGHECARRRLPARARCEHVGTPVRREVMECSRRSACEALGINSAKPTLLVMGGSQGARSLNETVFEALLAIDEQLAGRPLQVLWSCGPLNLNSVQDAVRQAHLRSVEVLLYDYIKEVEEAFAAADLIISRAGASTLAEITAVGRPSILIPFPHAKDNHQVENARSVTAFGAGILMEETKFRPRDLADAVLSILRSDPRREAMSKAALAMGNPRAAEAVASHLMNGPSRPAPDSAERQRPVSIEPVSERITA